MKKQAEMLKAMNQEERRAGTCPVSRLYGQVTVLRPVRESEVIFLQQVTEIYGGEGGWDSLAWLQARSVWRPRCSLVGYRSGDSSRGITPPDSIFRIW